MPSLSSLARRGVALLVALSVGACATGPGPIETHYTLASSRCAAGAEEECKAASALYPQVLAEQQQRQAQNDQAAAAVAAGLLGVLAGAAVGAASAPRTNNHIFVPHGRHR